MAKAAVTAALAFMVTEQGLAVPLQAPDQPVNTELALADALRLTRVPALKAVPAGDLITVPLPDPVVETVKVNWETGGI
jgi:hypothetical protein